MPKSRRMKLMEESYGASGEVPEYGAIFMSNSSTRKECLKRELFGLPMGQADFVKQVKSGMILFLFEFESRELHGVFQACSDGAINIEPNAYHSSGKQFPAQVKFFEKWRCRPLRESEFRDAICENYFMDKKFNFGLSKAQVQKLLSLFSLKKVERSRTRKTAGSKPTRESERNWGNTAGGYASGNHRAGETEGDVDRVFPFRVASAGEPRGRRLTTNYGFRDESYIGPEYDTTKVNEYSGDTSGACRRLADPKRHGSKDRVGNDLGMNNSFGAEASTMYSDYSLVNDQRVPKNLRHSASAWSENQHHDKDGIAQASSWSNHKEHLKLEADSVVPARSLVPVESRYGENTAQYDPCEPGIMGYATMKSSRHDLGAPIVGSMGTNYDGGYVSDTLPSETVQRFPDEHDGTSMNKTGSLGLDLYIPMPTAHPEYQANTGMIAAASCSESEFESRNGHMRHSQFPGLTSDGDTENMRNFERLSYSNRHSIFPSFAYPSPPMELSPKHGVNNEISGYQHQEGFGGHVSSSNDRVVRDSKIYPSFTYPSTTGDGNDLYTENRSQNNIQAYRQHEEFGGDASGSDNRVIRANPAEFERKRTRESVFSKLARPSKERAAEKDTPVTESVDEVMAFLNECHENWVEQNRPSMSNVEDFRKQKKKKENSLTREALDYDLLLPFTETASEGLLDCEENLEHGAQKLPFIDFKRRSKAQMSNENPTMDSPEQSAPNNKKRKLLRPKLIEDSSEKDRGSIDNPSENVMASQSAGEVPTVHDFLGRGDQPITTQMKLETV